MVIILQICSDVKHHVYKQHNVISHDLPLNTILLTQFLVCSKGY